MALAKLYKGTLRVSHKTIAKHTNANIEDLKNIITKYINNFKKFGDLRFKIADTQNSYLRIYYLNEQQAILLLSYIKDSKEIRKFKITLIKDFSKVKQELKTKDRLFGNDVKIDEISKALDSEIERNIKLTKEYKLTKIELLEALDKNYEAKELRKIAKKELLTLGSEFNQLQSKLDFLAESLEKTTKKILEIN